MRLFIAVELDEVVRLAAKAVADELQRGLAALGPASIGWVQTDRMHLTIRFFGEVPEQTAAELAARMAAPLSTAAFGITVSGVGVFPPRGPARVVWLGLPEGGTNLLALHDELEERLESLGLEPESRPFRPHLTLGRVKAPLPRGARDLLASASAAPIGRSRVREATLFQSRLSPRGATYTALARAKLAAARGDQR